MKEAKVSVSMNAKEFAVAVTGFQVEEQKSKKL